MHVDRVGTVLEAELTQCRVQQALENLHVLPDKIVACPMGEHESMRTECEPVYFALEDVQPLRRICKEHALCLSERKQSEAMAHTRARWQMAASFWPEHTNQVANP